MLFTSTRLKAVAFFFLGEIVITTLAPSVTFALTTGSNQTEYTSYEPIGTTDMVNLITGDFTYNAPLIDIPSPEGGFSLPLSYHSGIGLEDEASWAGLGWNINAGSISRTKVGGADDDLDNVTNVHVQDPGGSGYVKNYVLYQRSWDSQKGYGGAINLLDIAGISWGHGHVQDATVLGLTFDKDKAKFSPDQAMSGIATIGSLGAGSFLTQGGKSALNAGQIALANTASTGMDLAMAAQGLYSGYKSQGTTTGFIGEYSYAKTSSHLGFRQDYKYWLDATREEHNYGTLYLGQMKNNVSIAPNTTTYDDESCTRIGTPQQYVKAKKFPQAIYRDGGTPALTSDMYSYVEPDKKYAKSLNPTHLAYDAYAVMGPSIGGNMAPYRPDIGSLVYPKKLSNTSTKINLVPFLEEGVDINKIQFKYDGELSNTYDYHDSKAPGFAINSATTPDRRVYYNLTDTKLTSATGRTEADREGLYKKRIAQGKNVEWFTNAEMASNTPIRSGQVLEYSSLDDSNRQTYRTTWPPKGIGAFAITNADGTTYHYSLPVYNKRQVDFTGIKGQESTKFSSSTTDGWYATTWLLTAITGPDFVDRGQIGTVDAEDWGYWVRFDYGRFATDYQWRFPYTGYTYDGDRASYSKGVKETYYLNAIQTRSHTALFIKDVRKDGRGAYRFTTDGLLLPGSGYEDGKYPASSLLLREIVLLTNSDYQHLQSLGFNKHSTAGANVDQNELQPPSSAQEAASCSLKDVYDVYDVLDNPTYRTFMDQSAQRRIVLNTSYDLCQNTTNSFAKASTPPYLNGINHYADRLGKLTLKSISYFGANNSKLFPDFKFQYNGANPAYNRDAWDGWGSYNASGSSSHYSAYSDPTAWHLTDIITPLGGRLSVAYESDDYATISGEPIKQRVDIIGFSATDAEHGTLRFDTRSIAPYSLTDFLRNGATITLKGLIAKQQQRCWRTFGGSQDPEYLDYYISPTQQVQDLTATSFSIARPRLAGGYGNSLQGCSDATWYSTTGWLEITLPVKKGGGVRVASVAVSDDAGNEYKTGYLYTQSGARNGVTSGVVAQEPDLVKTVEYPFYQYYDYPSTPVLYSKVTVVEAMCTDDDYKQKTEYTFTTPDKSFMNVTAQVVTNEALNWKGYYNPNITIEDSKLLYFDVKNYTSKIGRIEKIKVVDKSNVNVAETEFTYTQEMPNRQGVFTSGSVLCEFEQEDSQTSNIHFKASRTAKTTYPNVLQSVRTTSNGVTMIEANRAWDFLTGSVLEKESTTAQGERFRTKVVPAYVHYPEMRTKAEQLTNKHMLSQKAASYIHKLDAAGNSVALVTAAVQTWNKDWTSYRTFDASTDQYKAEASNVPVWRQHKTYLWNNTRPNEAGTTDLVDFTDFLWSATANQTRNWKKRDEVTIYDHYSTPLEHRVLGGNYDAKKRGYNQSLLLVEATNAKYSELAYSGAEDAADNEGASYLGGEVRGAAYRSKDVSHTGLYSERLPAGQQGFLYRAKAGTADGLELGRAYQTSVWLHKSDLPAAAGRLFASIDNGSATTLLQTITIADPTVKRAGDWYLLDLYFTVPESANGQIIQVGCENTGNGTIYFDDFRFHPVDAPTTSYVYNPHTWQLTYTLNQDNLFVKREYDAAGRLTKTYREVLNEDKPDKPVSETVRNFARNRQFTLDLSVANGEHGTLTPVGPPTVYVGDDLEAVAQSTSCSWQPSSAFNVDGKEYYGSVTLPDGTKVAYDYSARTYQVSNLQGNHSLRVSFVDLGYPPAGTWYESGCETYSDSNCYTGRVIWRLADGCGGYTATDLRPAPAGACQNPPSTVQPCDQVQQ